MAPSTGNEQLDKIRVQLRDALAQLDALRYAPSELDKSGARRERHVLVARIEQLSQTWRMARRRDRAN
jgi:hypothetical protein